MINNAGNTKSDMRVAKSQTQNELFQVLYQELHARAHRERSRHGPSTLSTTALVHEAYVKLYDRPLNVESRQHFFHLAAQAMRQILVDHVRSRQCAKRGSGLINVTLEADLPVANELSVELIALDTALDKLSATNPRLAKLAEMHVFAGLDFREIAELLGTSERSIYRDWRLARVILRQQMT